MATSPTPPAATNPLASPAPSLPLADIHLPDPVSSWPAPGWWLLGLVVLVAVAVACYVGYQQLWRPYRQRQKQRAIQQALQARLQQARADWHQHQQAGRYITDLQTTLKLWCRHYAPEAMTLHGAAWLTFLQGRQAESLFDSSDSHLLQHGHYAPLTDIRDEQLDTLFQHLTHWLANATAPEAAPETAPQTIQETTATTTTTRPIPRQQESRG
ncbi:DUF4381 domain-containing protein [Oceanobacter sp. 5_MG-2023]|uniref:DUF4381 domain-containing protein n=1 Tax=Oceanobacter sp. 5_MG-2023 TaxID=3062645 RepID=UPI0026E2AF1D|nr:DUF4381 domain-containing protein [Oceanobacter sp. 5_MG-2023]MDO6682949.1 DUF4381 domain-containing protein [Oceanobacter sp. 5_MG-2023]